MAESYSLSQDLIEEILFKLPIKTLIRCTSVCKSWNSLIKSQPFINTHLSRAVSSPSHQPLVIVGHRSSGCSTEKRYSVRRENHEYEEHMQLDFPVPANTVVSVVGSCNGLICIRYKHCSKKSLMLWNPSIRKSVSVPRANHDFGYSSCYDGIGYDTKTDDYKIVTVPAEHHSVFVFSLKTNSWKTVSSTDPEIFMYVNFRRPAFVDGLVYWLARRRSQIESSNIVLGLDMSTEALTSVTLPESLLGRDKLLALSAYNKDDSSLIVFEAMAVRDELNMWIMRDNCGVRSWTRLLITVEQLGVSTRLSAWPVWGFKSNGQVLLHVCEGEGRTTVYDPGSHQIEHLSCLKDFTFKCSYVESLVLLDRQSS